MITCPGCHFPNALEDALQGYLGTTAQCRCRYCGIWWSPSNDEVLEAQENDDEQ